MTATVINLADRRPAGPTCGCPHHLLGDLAARLRSSLEACSGELLISGAEHAALLRNAVDTIERALVASEGRAKP